MAIAGKSSSIKTGGGAVRVLKTGLADVEVVAVNPDLKELNALGINTERTPEYNKERDGVNNVQIDFWIKNEEIGLSKVTFFLSEQNLESQSGKTQFINKYGKTAWLVDENDRPYDWYVYDGLRKTYRGEEDLHNFIWNYLNCSFAPKAKDPVMDECQLENVAQYFQGDFSELKTIVKTFHYDQVGTPEGANSVRVLLGVRTTDDDKQFQVAYTRHFEKTHSTPNYEVWNKKVTDPYSEFRADHQNSFELKDYVKTEVAFPDKDVVTDTSGDGNELDW